MGNRMQARQDVRKPTNDEISIRLTWASERPTQHPNENLSLITDSNSSSSSSMQMQAQNRQQSTFHHSEITVEPILPCPNEENS